MKRPDIEELAYEGMLRLAEYGTDMPFEVCQLYGPRGRWTLFAVPDVLRGGSVSACDAAHALKAEEERDEARRLAEELRDEFCSQHYSLPWEEEEP